MKDALWGRAARNGAEIERDLERVSAITARLDERKTQKAGTLSGGE
jgi:ABC-type branched-subunit amino acid transport system ATPase component